MHKIVDFSMYIPKTIFHGHTLKYYQTCYKINNTENLNKMS